MATLPTTELVLTRNELAKVLKVSRNFLDHISTRGDGPPFYRVGRAVRYDKAAVEKWITGKIGWDLQGEADAR